MDCCLSKMKDNIIYTYLLNSSKLYNLFDSTNKS